MCKKFTKAHRANILNSIQRITQQNHGKSTPRVDKIVVRTATERAELYKKVN